MQNEKNGANNYKNTFFCYLCIKDRRTWQIGNRQLFSLFNNIFDTKNHD